MQRKFKKKMDFYYLLKNKKFNCKTQGERSFELESVCRFCYQTPQWMQICVHNTTCKKSSWKRFYKTNCTVHENIICLGNRNFQKNIECNWTSGHKWNAAMVLSATLGGFGIDRFYLGQFKVSGFKISNVWSEKINVKFLNYFL